MPQPLSTVKPNASYTLADIGFSPFFDQPALAILAMEAIEAWANVEFFMLKLYVSLAGGPQSDAAAVFLALESNSTKTAAIAALVSRRLNDDYKALYWA